jgi:hypothetical protein
MVSLNDQSVCESVIRGVRISPQQIRKNDLLLVEAASAAVGKSVEEGGCAFVSVTVGTAQARVELACEGTNTGDDDTGSLVDAVTLGSAVAVVVVVSL